MCRKSCLNSFNGTLDSERIVEEDRKTRKGGAQSEADRVTESPVTAPVTGGRCAGYRWVIRHSKGSSCLDGSGQYLPGNQMKPLCLHTFQVGFTVSQGSRIGSFPEGAFP